MEKKGYSIREAAECLSVSISTVKQLLSEGRLQSVKIYRRVVIPDWALDELLQPKPESQQEDPWRLPK